MKSPRRRFLPPSRAFLFVHVQSKTLAGVSHRGIAQMGLTSRRHATTLIGGAAAVWPLAARAQQPDRSRRIGALMNLTADDPESRARIAAFVQGLQQLGWTEGR